MSKTEKLQFASFRGVPFLVPSDTTTRGQKIALHEYPNRDDRFAEPLGKIPPTMNLTCIIHGESFIQRRLQLEEALEVPGVGELLHPIYGSIQMQAGEYTINSTQKEVGKFVFNIVFYKSVDISPTPIADSAKSITNKANIIREDILNGFVLNYNEPKDSLDLDIAVTAQLSVLDSIANAVGSVAGKVDSVTSEFNSTVNGFKNKITRIMQSAQSVRDSIENTYNTILQLTLFPDALLGMWDSLVGVGMSDDKLDIGSTSTVKRSNNSNNQSLIFETTRLTAMIGLIESISFTEFGTTDDFDNALLNMDGNYTLIFELNSPGPNGIILLTDDQAIRFGAADLRASTRRVLDSQLVNIWRVVDTGLLRTSMSLLSYRFYGSFGQIEQLSNLNDGTPSSNFFKIVKAVTR